MYIEIIHNLGQTMKNEKTKLIDVKNLAKGFYNIKFYLNFGYLLVKSFVKN